MIRNVGEHTEAVFQAQGLQFSVKLLLLVICSEIGIMEHPEMKIRLVEPDLMGNLQIFTPVLIGFQPSYPGDDRIAGRFTGDMLEGLYIHNVGNDITVQPGTDLDKQLQ